MQHAIVCIIVKIEYGPDFTLQLQHCIVYYLAFLPVKFQNYVKYQSIDYITHKKFCLIFSIRRNQHFFRQTLLSVACYTLFICLWQPGIFRISIIRGVFNYPVKHTGGKQNNSQKLCK